jgi:hypothetical protein
LERYKPIEHRYRAQRPISEAPRDRPRPFAVGSLALDRHDRQREDQLPAHEEGHHEQVNPTQDEPEDHIASSSRAWFGTREFTGRSVADRRGRVEHSYRMQS